MSHEVDDKHRRENPFATEQAEVTSQIRVPDIGKVDETKHDTAAILVRAGAISHDQAREALVEQYVEHERTGVKTPLGEILVRRGFIRYRQLRGALSEQGIMRSTKPKEIQKHTEDLREVSREESGSLNQALDELNAIAEGIIGRR